MSAVDTATAFDLGTTKYVEARVPTDSEVGAQIDDWFTDSSTGTIWTCRVATFGSQEWLGTDGSVVGGSILSPSHPNLLAMYTMDNVSGATLVDESPNGTDATLANAVFEAGVIGNQLVLNGTSGEAQLDDPSAILATSSGAISCWVYDVSAEGALEYDIFRTGNNLGNAANLSFMWGSSNKLRFRLVNSSNQTVNIADSDIVGDQDAWVHCVIQSDGATYTMFIDGVSSGLTFTSGSNTGAWFTYQPLLLASLGVSSSGDTPTYKKARLDQWRYFDRALTQGEVDSLYAEGAP